MVLIINIAAVLSREGPGCWATRESFKDIGDTLCADIQGRAVLSKVARLLEESRLLGEKTEPVASQKFLE